MSALNAEIFKGHHKALAPQYWQLIQRPIKKAKIDYAIKLSQCFNLHLISS